VLPGFVLIGAGLLLFVLGAREIIQGVRTRSWSVASGAITHSELEEQSRDRLLIRQYRVVLSYAFDVAGEKRIGHRVTIDGGTDLLYRRSAQALRDRYPVGTPVDVFFDAADPSRTVLERGVPRGVPLGLAFAACLVLGGVLVVTGRP